MVLDLFTNPAPSKEVKNTANALEKKIKIERPEDSPEAKAYAADIKRYAYQKEMYKIARRKRDERLKDESKAKQNIYVKTELESFFNIVGGIAYAAQSEQKKKTWYNRLFA